MCTSGGCALPSTRVSTGPCRTRCAARATCSAMASEPAVRSATLRMSSARLALLYMSLVTVLTAALLVTVYLITRNALEREINTVIRAEVDDLGDDLRLGGVDRVAATLRLRADSWARTSAVFLLADENFRP